MVEPPHTRTAATRPALGFANQGPATRVQRGPWADPASRLCSTSQENPTSTTAYFPGHHLRHAATDIPDWEPAVASAFWLTRKAFFCRFRRRPHRVPTKVDPSPSCLAFPGPSLRTASGGRPHGEPIIQQPKYLHSHRYTPPGVSYILMLFNLAICPICPMGSRNVPVPEVRSPYTLHAHRMHAEYPLANLDDDVDLE